MAPELPPGLANQRLVPVAIARALASGALAVVVACAASATLAVPASADRLTDRREQLKTQIAQTHDDLDDSSAALSAATARVQATAARLATARAALAQTERELAAAKARDIAMAAKLKQAQLELDKAKAAVVEGLRLLAAQRKTAADIVRNQYQQQTNLLPIAMVVDDSTADLATRLQWSTTLFDTTAAELDRLKELQAQLAAKQARQAELERQVAAQRKAAAENLELKKTLQARAAAQAAAVAGLLAQQQADQQVAAKELAADKARYAALVTERASVEKRIAIRIARAKAEAARKAAAERRAREAARRAASAHKAAQKARKSAAKRPSSSSSGSSSGSSGSSSGGFSSGGSSSGGSASHGFSLPVSASITSPFGQRFHPIRRIWKLHDGTDFGAGCGSTLRAPHSGRVAERYFNGAYGNRLMIDHGVVDGRFVTTGYNHATRYVVGVGQHVRKGQVIGYVGTTGLSTGCHLHLMVWLDGRLVNPMRWF